MVPEAARGLFAGAFRIRAGVWAVTARVPKTGSLLEVKVDRISK
jgi:hypothetical protein